MIIMIQFYIMYITILEKEIWDFEDCIYDRDVYIFYYGIIFAGSLIY